MSKRFMLTATGLAAAAVGGNAAAELISFEVHNDYYISENSWQIVNSSGTTVASMYLSAGSIYIPTSQSSTYGVSFGLWGSSAAASGYRTNFQMDLPAGTYTLQMQDSWGDGWVWNSAFGSDAFNVAGNLASGSSVTFAMQSTSSVTGTFTVVPAPGALALLGLAGIAGRRKRA
ncbi:MAG: hypothetical protein CBB84_006935 [Phycisphaera sp. TMED24]|nr:MAG: hypothetical protein CBB84_006935 [Phycisphaera sp. TMED24]